MASWFRCLLGNRRSDIKSRRGRPLCWCFSFFPRSFLAWYHEPRCQDWRLWEGQWVPPLTYQWDPSIPILGATARHACPPSWWEVMGSRKIKCNSAFLNNAELEVIRTPTKSGRWDQVLPIYVASADINLDAKFSSNFPVSQNKHILPRFFKKCLPLIP